MHRLYMSSEWKSTRSARTTEMILRLVRPGEETAEVNQEPSSACERRLNAQSMITSGGKVPHGAVGSEIEIHISEFGKTGRDA